MRKLLLTTALCLCCLQAASWARADPPSGKNFSVDPQTYDPANTNLVYSQWLSGIGCPTNAGISTTGGNKPDTTYTDPACPTGDSNNADKQNQGLFLVKTGPTGNYAAALANINGLAKGTVLTELGYDIRKQGPDQTDPRGSHCGAGAPRFDITLSDGTSYFLGCNSPPPDSVTSGNGWLRLRWGVTAPLMAYNASTGLLTNISGQQLANHGIQIVFDEGQDTGPDNFGAAVLDNIDVNGVLSGRH